eukprot:1183331-Prorocentrum_minimum.AAC.4
MFLLTCDNPAHVPHAERACRSPPPYLYSERTFVVIDSTSWLRLSRMFKMSPTMATRVWVLGFAALNHIV